MLAPIHHKLIRRILLITCGLCILFFLFISLITVFNPYDLDSFEGILFAPALQIAKGGQIYGYNIVLNGPFMYATYGPLYYVLHGLLLQLTGVAFWPGRLISLLATAATATVIYRAVKHSCSEKVSGLVAATMFIMMTPTFAFGALQRVDALGVLGAISAVALSFSAVKRRTLFIAGCAASLAFLTKPTFIAAGVSVTVFFLLMKRFRELGLFLLGGASVLIIAIAMLVISNNGGYWFNVSNANLPFSFGIAMNNIRSFVQSYTTFAALVILAAALTRWRLSKSDPPNNLILLYLIIAGGISVLICGRVGASINYFYEPAAGLAIFVGLEFGKLKLTSNFNLKAVASILLVMAFFMELILFRSSYIQGRLLLPLHKAPLYAKLSQDILALVPEGDPVASDYQEPVLRANRLLYFNDLTMYQIGSEAMRSRIQSYLDDKKLAAIISYQQRSLPGYKLIKGYGYYNDPTSTTGVVSNGPFLYLREDLCRRYSAPTE